MKPNLETTIIKKIEAAKAGVAETIFKAWQKSKPEEREALHAEMRTLDKLTFRLIKSIRGHIDG